MSTLSLSPCGLISIEFTNSQTINAGYNCSASLHGLHSHAEFNTNSVSCLIFLLPFVLCPSTSVSVSFTVSFSFSLSSTSAGRVVEPCKFRRFVVPH